MSLFVLRENTKVMHSDLEKNLNLFETVQTRDQYLQHLEKYYAWLAPLEDALESYANDFAIEWDKRKRASMLANDIQNLGGVAKAKSDKSLTPLNKAEAFGILYVIEGSKLGGQFISKHFELRLGLEPAKGLSFYHGRGSETASLWKKFLHKLENHMNENPQTVDETYQAANKTFASIKAALCF